MTACTSHYAVLHTQEVTGSSPAVSTKKFLISQEIRNFFLFMISKVTLHFGVFRLTQTVTQKPRGQESTGEGRMASSVPLRLFCGLHGLADDAADGVGGVTLHPLRGVGVGAEGKARVVVTQRTGQRLDVHAVLEGQRGEGMSEVVKPDVFRAVPLQPGTGRSCPPAVSSSLAFPTSAGGSPWQDWRGAAAPPPPAPDSCSAACGCPAPRGC